MIKIHLLVIGASILLTTACEDFGEKGSDNDEYPVQTEFQVQDFTPASQCGTCHPDQYREWSGSMHAYAMQDPIFFTSHTNEQMSFLAEGEQELGQFCIQCHSPIAFLSNSISDPTTLTLESVASLEEQIQEGIGCDFCHSITYMSGTTHVNSNTGSFSAVQYFLQTGDVKYGTITDPIPTALHESRFHPGYSRSEFCRSCHDLTINGADAEITFTEWEQSAFNAMGIECQGCHMQTYEGYAVDPALFPDAPERQTLHRHTFAGVDQALTPFAGELEQYDAITELLSTAATLSFYTPAPDTLVAGDTAEVQIIITNSTGHNLPSGVTFARQLWLEVILATSTDTLFQSGLLNDSLDLYDFHQDPDRSVDPQLTLFNSVLYDAKGDSGLRQVSVERMTHMSDYTIPPQSFRLASYRMSVPEGTTGDADLTVRLRFRALPPFVLRQLGHGDLVSGLTIFDCASLSETIHIIE